MFLFNLVAEILKRMILDNCKLDFLWSFCSFIRDRFKKSLNVFSLLFYQDGIANNTETFHSRTTASLQDKCVFRRRHCTEVVSPLKIT